MSDTYKMEESALSSDKNQGLSTNIVGPICFTIEAIMVFANILPILVVTCYKKKREKTTTDVIILGLSITDILSVLVPAPLGIPAYFLQRWYGGEITCQIYHLISIWLQLASMCLVTYMCLDCWCILRRVMVKKTIEHNLNKTRITIVGLYTFTLCIAVLPVAGLTPKAISNTGLSCRSWVMLTSPHIKEHIFYIVFLILGYSNLIVTVSINAHVIYSLILLKRKYGSFTADRQLTTSLKDNEMDHRSIVEMNTMTVVVTLIFYLAWLPVLVLIGLVKSGNTVGGIAIMYALLSTSLTGLLNPILYAVFTNSYKCGYTSLVKSVTQRLCYCCTTRSIFFGIGDDIQCQTSNVISNAGSEVGLLPHSNQIVQGDTNILAINLQQENNCHDNFSQIMSSSEIDLTCHGEYPAHTDIKNSKRQEADTSMQLVKTKYIAQDNTAHDLETIYFDDTIQSDTNCDGRSDQSSHKIYDSELSILSRDIEDDESDIEVRV